MLTRRMIGMSWRQQIFGVAAFVVFVSSTPAELAGAGCSAKRAQFVVGNTYTAEIGNRARLAAGAETLRVLRTQQPETTDYRQQRLNLYLDRFGLIARVRCG
jgi:Peptidase inhibitor I78 family